LIALKILKNHIKVAFYGRKQRVKLHMCKKAELNLAQGIVIMNKSELIDEIQRTKGEDCSKACAERSLDAVLQAIVNGVAKTGSVQLIGFGTFSVSTRAPRMGVNPKTKEKIQIPASKSIKFRVGTKLKNVAK